MRIAVACRALLVASLCLLPKIVHAQGGVLGSIVGNVFDQTGQPAERGQGRGRVADPDRRRPRDVHE